jgi:uncharacterized coiled-coil protein SlyX
MTTVAKLEARIVELEAALALFPAALNETLRAALTEALKPLAQQCIDAHARIDHAGDVFKALRKAMTPGVVPGRLPRTDFDAALAELRSDAGNDRAFFPVAVIRERALARRTLRENTEAAAH